MDDEFEFIVADIPGLIEGAAEGRGLGHQFLRHIERARALCVLINLLPLDGIEPDEQLRILLHELEAYQPELLERPRIVVGTKSDSVSHEDMKKWQGNAMSAVTGDGVKQIVGQLAQMVKTAREEIPPTESTVIIKPLPEGSWVEKIAANEFRVHGRGAERAVALNDVTSPEALSYIDERLTKLGVQKLLVRAGANAGDVIWIGGFSFEYVPEGGA